MDGLGKSVRIRDVCMDGYMDVWGRSLGCLKWIRIMDMYVEDVCG